MLSQSMDNSILNVTVESENIEAHDVTYKIENSSQQNNLTISEVPNESNAIQCFVNQDNTLSFINNSNVFQTMEGNSGDIYYACISSANDINQQNQVLQLIPQNQISNYIISDKAYPNINFVSDSSMLTGNNYFGLQNSSFTPSKYNFENVDANVFKSINCIGKQLCEICSLEFPSKRTYLKHMSIHENDREFKCSWCKLSYNYEVNLLVHVAIIHNNECTIVNEKDQQTNYKCAICSCIFSRKKAHQAHCLIHQVDEELPCELCSAQFKCKILLEKHINDHKMGNGCQDNKLSTNYLKCKLCHQLFNNVGNVKKHYIKFHPKNIEQWAEDVLSTKEETVPLNTEANLETPLKRRSSKIASQTIKLYAQGKSKSHQIKSDDPKLSNKRGRPKKSESKSSKNNSNCAICSKTFKTPILLRRHEVTHTGVKEFECSICKKGFTQKSSVKIHMAVHANIKEFSCPFCSKTFTYEHNMNTHIKVIHRNDSSVHEMEFNHGSVVKVDTNQGIIDPISRFQGHSLNKEDVSLEEITVNPQLNDDVEISQYLWNDTQTEHPISENSNYQPNQLHEDIYLPSTSNFVKVDWDKSQQVTENRGILLSEDVERVDKETGQIQVHEVIKDQVTGFKRFRCRFCYKLYRKSGDLTRHVRIHNQQKPFQCYLCHKSFRLKSVLLNHFKSHWKLKEYTCEVCKKSFNLKQTLKVHQQLHTPYKLKYTCKTCDKRFNTSFHYKYHINNNHRVPLNDSMTDTADEADSNRKPVRTFMWNDLLNQPVAIPDVPKKSNNSLFKCNHCGKSYKFKKYLNEHLKDHLSSNKTNICHFCNKSFLTFRSMQQHLRTQHLNRRKFTCTQCPANFITKASLIRHGLVHSNSKPFACPLCFRRFKAKIYCDRHISAKKCIKKSRLSINANRTNSSNGNIFLSPAEVNTFANQIGSELVNHEQTEGFSTFRLEDLDMSNAQSSNILVSNYVNDFSTFPNSEKYMIVSLDNSSNKDSQSNVQDINSTNQNNYYTIDESTLVDITRNQMETGTDPSENLMGLLEGQIGVTPIDINSIFAVQNYNANIGSLSNQIGDRNNQTNDIDYSQQENIYYYQTVNDIPTDCQETVKGSLADKFPILKASLFSEDECGNSKVKTNSGTANQFILSTVNAPVATGNYQELNKSKLYHGCANCNQQFKDSESLVQHVKTEHPIRKDFVCNFCHKAFSAKLSLWAHSKTHSDSRSFGCFACIACNQRFISVPSLSRHVRMQHNDNLNLYRCTHCDRVYKTTRELDSHVKQLMSEYDALIINSNLVESRHSNELVITGIFPNTKKDVDLDIDKVQFDSLNSSQIDQIASLDYTNASQLSMKELIKAAKARKGMLINKKRNKFESSTINASLTYPYSCSICTKGFNRASNLQQHLSVHTKVRPYQCTKCNHRFRHRCSLKTHEATKHNPITKLLRCQLCSKLLRSHVALGNHMKIHFRLYPFQCNECDNNFQTSRELAKHVLLIHETSKTEENPSITDSFSTVVVDLNEPKNDKAPVIPKKLFKCLSCSVIFNNRLKYDNHYCISRNTLPSEQSQPNTCCDKTFESTSHLLSHVQEVHQQIIQYNCAQCNIIFAQESSFINHQKSVHHL